MKTKKKLIASLFALVVAVSLAATTTYAWFTMNEQVNVGNFDLRVTMSEETLLVSTAEQGIYSNGLDLSKYIEAIVQMSKDSATGWGLDVKKDENNENRGFRMNAAAYNDTDGKFAHDYSGMVAATGFSAAVETITKTTLQENLINAEDEAKIIDSFEIDLALLKKGILAFNLYFRGYGEYDVVLDMGKDDLDSPLTSVTASGTDNTKGMARAWNNLTEVDYGVSGGIALNAKLATRAANAVRVGFGVDTDKKIENIWEPNAAAGFSFNRSGEGKAFTGGRNLAQDYYNVTLGHEEDLDNLAKPVQFPKYSPSLVSLASSFDEDEQIEYEETNPVKLLTLEEVTADSGIFEGKMTVVVWLEGWDEDCLDTITSDIFNVSLAFKVYHEA